MKMTEKYIEEFSKRVCEFYNIEIPYQPDEHDLLPFSIFMLEKQLEEYIKFQVDFECAKSGMSNQEFLKRMEEV